jgi:hypothetical protein
MMTAIKTYRVEILKSHNRSDRCRKKRPVFLLNRLYLYVQIHSFHILCGVVYPSKSLSHNPV